MHLHTEATKTDNEETPFLTNHCNTICEGRVEESNLIRCIGNVIRVNTDTHTLNLLHNIRVQYGQKSS